MTYKAAIGLVLKRTVFKGKVRQKCRLAFQVVGGDGGSRLDSGNISVKLISKEVAEPTEGILDIWGVKLWTACSWEVAELVMIDSYWWCCGGDGCWLES